MVQERWPYVEPVFPLSNTPQYTSENDCVGSSGQYTVAPTMCESLRDGCRAASLRPICGINTGHALDKISSIESAHGILGNNIIERRLSHGRGY